MSERKKKGTAKQAGAKTGKKGKYWGESGGKLFLQGLEMEFMEMKTTGNESGFQKQAV